MKATFLRHRSEIPGVIAGITWMLAARRWTWIVTIYWPRVFLWKEK